MSYMPWIVALAIGIVSAVVNIWIGIRLIKANKENTLTQFKATVGTKNRQEWINAVRHHVSELISHGNIINIVMRMEPSPSDATKFFEHYEKISYSKSQIEMLLNLEKNEQKELLDAINQVVDASLKDKKAFDVGAFTKARFTTVEVARKLFQIHWEKIKNLQ